MGTVKGVRNTQGRHRVAFHADIDPGIDMEFTAWVGATHDGTKPESGAYVNREKLLAEVAKTYGVAIYEPGYETVIPALGGPMIRLGIEKRDVGYHRA